MLRFLFGFKWQKSQAHLLLLSKFVRPHTVEDYENLSIMPWKQVLGEAPSKAINRFIGEGMLKDADNAKSLEWKYKIPDLKKMLKGCNLPVSGNKSDLILRLIESDPNRMKEYVSGLNVLLCSEQGRQIAEAYLTIEKEKQHKVEQQVLNALQKRKFKEASLLRSSFEAEQVFPCAIVGLGTDWRNPDVSRDYWQKHDPAGAIALLEIIFTSNPKILKNLNKEWLEHLRIGAGMMCLWGTNMAKKWLPPNLETGLIMNGDTVARMIMFHARNQVNLAQWRKDREWGVESVDISAAGYGCEACEKIADKKFKIDEVIELPYERCTCEMGCRCCYLPVID